MSIRTTSRFSDGTTKTIDVDSYGLANRIHHAFNRLGVPTTIEVVNRQALPDVILLPPPEQSDA